MRLGSIGADHTGPEKGAGWQTINCLRFWRMGEAEPGRAMHPISFKRHRFPPDVIRYAVWLYLRFTLSIREVRS